MDETISPAVQMKDSAVSKEVSAEDFQRQLYTWFQDKGLMADLKSHLRMKMINILRDSSALERKVKNSVSPKLQAVNLLIAEYLLYKEYHYSLSVFSTEVPLNTSFKERAFSGSKKTQFDVQDMWDILEIVGITKDSQEGGDIHDLYYSTDLSEPLLTCIIRVLHDVKSKSSQTKLATDCCENVQPKPPTAVKLITDGSEAAARTEKSIIKNISELLAQAKVDPKYITAIVDQFTAIVQSEIERIKRRKQKECQQLKNRIRSDSKHRIEECKRKVHDLEKIFEEERRRLEQELEKSKHDLKDCALSLEIKTDEVEKRERIVHEKEIFLRDKERSLKEREERLHRDLQALFVEKSKLRDWKKSVEAGLLNKYESIMNGARSDIACNYMQVKENKEQQTSNDGCNKERMLKEAVKHLEEENEKLRARNAVQCVDIQDLLERSEKLMFQIDQMRSVAKIMQNVTDTIHAPSSAPQIQSMSPQPVGVLTTEPPHAGAQQQYHHHHHNHQQMSHGMSRPQSAPNGAGDKPGLLANFFPARLFNRQQQNQQQRPRSPPIEENVAGVVPQPPNCPSDISPTDQMLKAARTRLLDLEMESQQIERNYNQYKTRTRFTNEKACKDLISNANLSLADRLILNIASVRENINKIMFGIENVDDELMHGGDEYTGKVAADNNVSFLYADPSKGLVPECNDHAVATCTATPIGNILLEQLLAEMNNAERNSPSTSVHPGDLTISTSIGISSDSDAKQQEHEDQQIKANVTAA